ncbi:MAG: hypothetical protein E6352_09810 [Streptococcus salivarius]|nr:hypothetical protein [Streptococcus salivarius]
MNKRKIANVYFIAGILFYNSLETLFSTKVFWGIIKLSFVIIFLIISYNVELKNEKEEI